MNCNLANHNKKTFDSEYESFRLKHFWS